MIANHSKHAKAAVKVSGQTLATLCWLTFLSVIVLFGHFATEPVANQETEGGFLWMTALEGTVMCVSLYALAILTLPFRKS